MTNDTLAQTRALNNNGTLERISTWKGEIALIASFAMAVMEKSNGTHPELQAFGAWIKENENNGTMYSMATAALRVYLRDVLPPIPALDDIESRAGRAVDKIWELPWNATRDKFAEIITAAMRGDDLK